VGTGNCADVIDFRRSVRDLSGEVPEEVVRDLLRAGARAPSPHNTQPWRFVVLGQSSKSRLAAVLYERYVAKFGDEPGAEERASRLRARIEAAPLVLLLCLDRSRIRTGGGREHIEWVMATQSLAAAAENIWLAAVSRGFDAAWIAAPLAVGEAIRDALGMNGSLEPQILMLLGRRSIDPMPKSELGWRDLTTFLERSPADERPCGLTSAETPYSEEALDLWDAPRERVVCRRSRSATFWNSSTTR
jgi:nitroreductase